MRNAIKRVFSIIFNKKAVILLLLLFIFFIFLPDFISSGLFLIIMDIFNLPAPTTTAAIKEILLVITIIFTVFYFASVHMMSDAKNRPHNLTKLVNEITPRVFFNYCTFFFTLLLFFWTEDVGTKDVASLKVVSCIALGSFPFILSLVSISANASWNNDEMFTERHTCVIVDNRCTTKMSFGFITRSIWFNTLFSIIYFLIVTYILLFTSFLHVVPKP